MSEQPPYDRPDGRLEGQGRGVGDGPGGPAPGVPYPGSPPEGSQGYGQPSGPPRNGMGTAALVLGIIAAILAVVFFPLGILLGIVAVVLGFLGRKKADRREATNKGQATAGLVLGIVAVVVGGLIAAFVGNFIADNSEEIGNLSECTEDAAGDEDALAACQEEFADEIGAG